MLVENSIQQNHFPSEYPDFSEIFHTELFGLASGSNSSSPSSSPRSPSLSDPSLSTPPQPPSLTSFPSIEHPSPSEFFNFNIDEEIKAIDPLVAPSNFAPYDFLSFGSDLGLSASVPTLSPESLTSPSSQTLSDIEMLAHVGIDPIAVDTPATSKAMSDFDREEAQEEEQDADEEQPIIAPVKVAGHGKGRKGTVQSGGVVKKTASHPTSKEKENSGKKSSASSPRDNGKEKEEDEDELPIDWRPPPEVYQKMSSKEKRQLRNKISARNFRVRRKEYISTLEGDIAERDRLLSAIRSELGSSRSENVALRQEISALKRALLAGRSSTASISDPLAETDIEGVLNLPPPAPLPSQSAAATLLSSPPVSTSNDLLTPNTQKDLPTSPRLSSPRAFWGGAHIGLGGGYTPVHTAIINTPQWPFANAGTLQENLNPALNAVGKREIGKPIEHKPSFEGFSDLNPFTMKTLDAYRMQLWGKMAAQQQQTAHYGSQFNSRTSPPASNLASNMRPHYFANSTKHNTPSSPPLGGSSLSSILSGKASPSYAQPSSSSYVKKEKDVFREREYEQQEAMVAALASQTLLKRLGSAFWDAFSGSSATTPDASSSTAKWDADKVRRVLEGKAVVRVVDVEPTPSTPLRIKDVRSTMPSSSSNADSDSIKSKKEKCDISSLLEESMRSLSLGKKH